MDKLRAMGTFVQIADQGSLTAAARVLDSSLPAVVRSLAAYEAGLGVRLFHRTTRRIALTEEGRSHLARCRQVLTAVDEAETALSASAAEPTGHLTVTAPMLFGQMHVSPAVTRFVQQHPKMRCNVALLDRVVNLVEEGIDIGVRIGPLEDSNLVAVPMGQIRRVVAVNPARLKQRRAPRHPKDLLELNCIRLSDHRARTWSGFRENGKRFSVAVQGNLEFNQIAPAVQACAAGAGFGRFFSYQVAPYLQTGELQLVLEKFEDEPQPIHLVYPHARLLPTRTRAFIDWMREELKGFMPAARRR